jgi:hypothetical protein
MRAGEDMGVTILFFYPLVISLLVDEDIKSCPMLITDREKKTRYFGLILKIFIQYTIYPLPCSPHL